MSEAPFPLRLRPFEEGDRGFVLSSWLKSYVGKSDDGYEDLRDMYRDYAPVALDVLARSTVVVACLPDEPTAVVGWYALEGETLHYVLVKPRWRRLGVARWLLEDFASLPVPYTHLTSDASKCPIPPTWTYRRWKIWKETGHEAASRGVSGPSEHLAGEAA